MTKIKLASTAMAAIALASAGVIAMAARTPQATEPARELEAQAEVIVQAPAVEDLIDVRGIVVDPAGKPVAGATVSAIQPAPVPETTTGPDGRFHLRVPHPDAYFRRILKQHPQLVASAPGFGLNRASPPYPVDPSFELKIPLVEEGPAIEGRLLDLEGRPVVGAKVKPNVVYFAESGSLDTWIAKAKAKNSKGFDGLWGIVTLKGEVMTGADGRFRFTGLGRERVASFGVSGPTIASSSVAVLLRDGPGFEGLGRDDTSMSPSTVVYHSPRFDVVLPPTKPIEGTVRDQDTGRPIAGLILTAGIFNQFNASAGPAVQAETDAEGHYRLAGLVKAPAYRITAEGSRDKAFPYINESRKVATDSPRLEPVRFDFSLKRASEIKGRVIDKATGLPVRGSVSAYAFDDNPNLSRFPGYDQNSRNGLRTDEDGRYRLFTVPGRAVLAFRAEQDRYRNGLGAEAITAYDPKRGDFGATIPRGIARVNYHALVEVDIKPGDVPTEANLLVESSRALRLTVVDPEGRPIDGLKVDGISPQSSQISVAVPAGASGVELLGLEPGKPRRVTVFHEGRRLVGSIWLRGDEAGPITVKLMPWGSVVGRVEAFEIRSRRVKQLETGNNSPGTKLEQVGILPGRFSDTVKLDKQNRFRVDGLMPGLKYAASGSDGEVILGDLFKDVSVESGEVKDLGDLKVTPYRP